jgi:hypothetical protein
MREEKVLKNKSKILCFEPFVFLFFGLFHIHRIWGLVDRTGYANFWLGVMNKRGALYFLIMGVLSGLCIAGIVVFFKNIGKNYWWRWIYVFGGGYVLLDLFSILMKFKVWNSLLQIMFDTGNIYWNYLWGFFIIIGVFSFLLGIHIIRIMIS